MTQKDQGKIRQLVQDGQTDAAKAMIRRECWGCQYGVLMGGSCTGRGYMEPPCVMGGEDE